MDFFVRGKGNIRPVHSLSYQRREFKVAMTGRDYSELKECSLTLKVWLPEEVEVQLGELTWYLNTSLSDLVRQILFQHLYGRYDLIGLVERQKFAFESPYAGVCSSVSEYGDQEDKYGEGFRPKIAGIKVFIPEQMRDDLKSLADAKHKTISEYVRNVIVNHLFGAIPFPGSTAKPPKDSDEGVEEA